MTWFNSAYGYKKAITVDHTKVSTANQSSFPMEVSFTDANLKTTGNGGRVTNSSGFDIIFVDSTETTKLDHEIEKYVASTGETLMHVRIPTLSFSADTVIYMYYGNSSISTSQENVNGVWDSNFKGVWHLKEATGTNAADSTSNALTATQSNSPTQGAAQVGGGLTFNGSTQQLNTGSTTAIGDLSIITVSAWVKISTYVSQATAVANYDGQGFSLQTALTSADIYFNAGGRYGFTASNVYTTGTWHLWTAVYDGNQATNAAKIKIYLDGVSQTLTYSGAIPASLGASANTLQIGNRPDAAHYLNGALDEVRISTIARSAGWIVTEYNNQSSPSTFYSVGSEQSQGIVLSVTFTGVGALTPTLAASTALSKTLTGVGTLTASSAQLKTSFSTSLAGVGSVVPTLTAAYMLSAVSFTGAGTLSGTTSLSTALSTTLTGNGALTPALSAALTLSSSPVAGQGALSGAPSLSTALTTIFAGNGVLIPTLLVQVDLGGVTLVGGGTLAGTYALSTSLSTSLGGTGVLVPALSAQMDIGNATLVGAGTLTASSAQLSVALSTILAGVGTSTPSISAAQELPSIALVGTSTLASGTPSLSTALATTLNGRGVLNPNFAASMDLGGVTFNGASTLTATPVLSTALASTLAAIGILTIGSADLSTALSTRFDGIGELLGTLSTSNTANLAVTMDGHGTLTETLSLATALITSLDGIGTLTYVTSLSTTLSVAFAGSGVLTETLGLSTSLSVRLDGVSVLTAIPSLSTGISASFVGLGALSATLSVGSTANLVATMPGVGALSGSGTFSVALATVSLDGTGVLTGIVALRASLTVAMTGQGTLAGAVGLSVALATTLIGTSSLSAGFSLPVALSVIFAAHGTLFAQFSGALPLPSIVIARGDNSRDGVVGAHSARDGVVIGKGN
jgi:hypothetical protein